MILNNAPAIYADGKMAERVYYDGEIVWGLPKEYQRVEYLESTGNQWIDTGVNDNNDNLRISIKFKLISWKTNSYNYPFGTWVSDATQNTGLLLKESTREIGGWVQKPFPTSKLLPFTLGDIHTAYVDKDVFMYDRVEYVLTFAPARKRQTLHIYMFKRNGAPAQTSGITGRIYSMKMLYSNEKLRDFIPCYRKSDFKPGMYDVVTKQFFMNLGTGEFGYELMDGTYVAPI